MKSKHFIVCLVAALLVLLGTGVLIPYALSYLSGLEEQGIAIRAAPAEEIWKLEGSFDEEKWEKSFASGISIKNISSKDLWIYYEYTGDLQQVFKHGNPFLIKAGETEEVILQALDDKDSPRLLNPLELIDCKSVKSSGGRVVDSSAKDLENLKWREFTGQLRFHILNEYASLETEEISISGHSLWNLYFARKYGEEAKDYYKHCQSQKGLVNAKGDCDVSESCEKQTDLDSSALRAIKQAQVFQEKIDSLELLDFIQPVFQAVDKIAGGIWEERDGLVSMLEEGKNTIQNLRKLLSEYMRNVDRLEQQIENQNQLIQNQQQLIQEKTQRIMNLENSNGLLRNQVEEIRNNNAANSDESGDVENNTTVENGSEVDKGSDTQVSDSENTPPDTGEQ